MPKTDIVLINPSNKKAMYGKLFESLAGIEPPLWIGLLAAFLRDKGFVVKIVDADAESFGAVETVEEVINHDPTLIVIGAIGANPSASSTPKMLGVRHILEILKEKNIKTKTLTYGIHPGALPERTLKEDNVDSIINRLNDFNLLKFIHPSIVYDTNLRSMINNIQDVLSWYDLLYLENKYEKWMVYLLALLDSLKIDDVEKNVKYFDLKNKLANPIRIAKGSGNDVLSKLSKKRTIKNSDIYKLLKDIPVEVCLYLMAKTNRQVTKKSFSNYISKLQNIKLHVKGNDLKKLGILPGQIYKEIFDSVFDAVLNEKVSGKEEEIKFIKKKYRLSN